MKRPVGIVLAAVVFTFLTVIAPVPKAAASPLEPTAAIERLFVSPQLQSEWFTSSFLRQVPLPQIERIIIMIEQTLGSYQEVTESNGTYQVVFEEGRVPTQIRLNSEGQIQALLFQPPIPNRISLSEVIEKLQALPDEVSFLILEGDSTLTELNANQSLAVGSAFKLAVLEALREQIAAGDRAWDDIVELQPNWKSLPSGILQSWPDNTPLTLQTLATLMISLSDNTATDALIYLLGRETIEKVSPHNRPFLTTQEAFALKNPQNTKLLTRYRRSQLDERRQILQEAQQAPLPGVDIFNGNPLAPDVEWFFSSRELCQLMESVATLPLMGTNPGVADPQAWQRVAFKGGSEPGVFNLTTWLESEDGKTYCVTVTGNNKAAPVNEASYLTLYKGAIEELK